MKDIDFRLSGEGDGYPLPYKYTPKNPIEISEVISRIAADIHKEVNEKKEKLLLEIIEILLGRVPTGDELHRRARRVIYHKPTGDEEIIELDGIPTLWFRLAWKDKKPILEYRRGV